MENTKITLALCQMDKMTTIHVSTLPELGFQNWANSCTKRVMIVEFQEKSMNIVYHHGRLTKIF